MQETKKLKLGFIKGKIKIPSFSIHYKHRTYDYKLVCNDIKTILANKPDNIVKIHNGLGNQLFQYAFSKSLKGKTIYDVSEYENVNYRKYALSELNIDDLKTISTPIIQDYENAYEIKEKTENHFEPELLTMQKEGVRFYDGFFQSEKYFKDKKEELQKLFTPKTAFTKEYLDVLNDMENTNSVLLHFRVGKDYTKLGWALNPKYQLEAMEYIKERVENPKFFVFGEDIERIKEIFKPKDKVHYIDIGHKTPPCKNILDFELMKHCKHAIPSNSTYAWWACWLNYNPNAIITAPDPWLLDSDDDIIPEGWHKIKAEKL